MELYISLNQTKSRTNQIISRITKNFSAITGVYNNIQESSVIIHDITKGSKIYNNILTLAKIYGQECVATNTMGAGQYFYNILPNNTTSIELLAKCNISGYSIDKLNGIIVAIDKIQLVPTAGQCNLELLYLSAVQY